ncbi:hypothetical protein RMSM_03385 [Rhodopirellula maiorica SM1]|uniref:Uncharacterized protein n=1 Tax=Rhodopirellula maiorica SM1 TaxID=1265738 RepID=M5RK80_9BACT|nr:hypothetical protein [Rhodopirellula maiorica]EMI19715.1 hypothetical protein RMSM_03385 [Rhodopirellula maiorica SM1]
MNASPSDDSDNQGSPHDESADEIQINEKSRSRSGQVTNDVDSQQIAQFVTTIKNAEQQVGEHIITALRHEDTVAVITTVVVGDDGQQRVVSAALNPARLQQVQDLLQAAADEREDEEPCVGFHCLVKPKQAS